MNTDSLINILIATVSLIILGGILGLLLAVADKYLTVKGDERIDQVTEMLPGYNCGSCGYPGCMGFAEGLLNGEVSSVAQCRPSKSDARVKIAEYLSSTPDANGNTINVKAE